MEEREEVTNTVPTVTGGQLGEVANTIPNIPVTHLDPEQPISGQGKKPKRKCLSMLDDNGKTKSSRPSVVRAVSSLEQSSVVEVLMAAQQQQMTMMMQMMQQQAEQQAKQQNNMMAMILAMMGKQPASSSVSSSSPFDYLKFNA